MADHGAWATATLVEALGRVVPDDRLVLDDDVLALISRDEAPWAEVGTAAVGVRARTESDVVHVVRVCADLGVPVVPRGAGSGLSGGANAVDGCVVLDLAGMDRVVEVDRADLVAVVQPGVVNGDLKEHVAEDGLWYPPDPASAGWSTIGGNVATNAGGLCCLKYGVTRDYILGLRAVVGGAVSYGTAAFLGRRTNKGVAGYDLAGLMTGSEGTLGVITEVTLRLRPAVVGDPATVVGAFTSLAAAGAAVAEVTRRGLVPAMLELLDRPGLEAVEEWKHLGLEADAEALLLARIDTPGAQGDAEADAVVAAFDAAGAAWAARSTDPDEAEALFAARRLVHPALERHGQVLSEDICVPRSRLADMLAEVGVIADRHGVMIATIAHAGDGNLHPLIVTPHDAEGARDRAFGAFEDLLDAAIGMGGTVTGEHGVGLLKRGGLGRELGPDVMALQRAVKQTFDPRNLFNPGKVLPA